MGKALNYERPIRKPVLNAQGYADYSMLEHFFMNMGKSVKSPGHLKYLRYFGRHPIKVNEIKVAQFKQKRWNNLFRDRILFKKEDYEDQVLRRSWEIFFDRAPAEKAANITHDSLEQLSKGLHTRKGHVLRILASKMNPQEVEQMIVNLNFRDPYSNTLEFIFKELKNRGLGKKQRIDRDRVYRKIADKYLRLAQGDVINAEGRYHQEDLAKRSEIYEVNMPPASAANIFYNEVEDARGAFQSLMELWVRTGNTWGLNERNKGEAGQIMTSTAVRIGELLGKEKRWFTNEEQKGFIDYLNSHKELRGDRNKVHRLFESFEDFIYERKKIGGKKEYKRNPAEYTRKYLQNRFEEAIKKDAKKKEMYNK